MPAPQHSEPPPADAVYYTVSEIATLMRVSTMTVYRLCDSGELRGYRIGRSVRVAAKDFNAYMRSADTWSDGAA